MRHSSIGATGENTKESVTRSSTVDRKPWLVVQRHGDQASNKGDEDVRDGRQQRRQCSAHIAIIPCLLAAFVAQLQAFSGVHDLAVHLRKRGRRRRSHKTKRGRPTCHVCGARPYVDDLVNVDEVVHAARVAVVKAGQVLQQNGHGRHKGNGIIIIQLPHRLSVCFVVVCLGTRQQVGVNTMTRRLAARCRHKPRHTYFQG